MDSEAARKNAAAYDAHACEWEMSLATNVGHKYLEKPAMRELLPTNLVSTSVLCVGVGSGDELADIVVQNPARVVGIDISEKLLEIARKKYPTVEFLTMDMMHMNFGDREFDFVYSSLTFHYADDWDALLIEMKRVLKPNGKLLFSAHNPSYWGKKPTTGNAHTNPRGVTLTEHTATLPGDIEITYYNHKDTNSILEALQHAGFVVDKMWEPEVLPLSSHATSKEREFYDELAKKNRSLPLFLIVSAHLTARP